MPSSVMSAQCNSAMESLADTQCFLSPMVQHLICETGSSVIVKDTEDDLVQQCLDEEGLLQWEYLQSSTFQGIDITEHANNFEELVSRLAPVCQVVDRRVSSLSIQNFRLRYYDKLQWTGMAELFTDCFVTLRSTVPVRNSVSLLLSTSALERSLGDVYLMRNSPCPSMLKDLLATDELRDILGDIVIFCLRVLIGPPTSLNLRNIVWHGFAAPQDIPVRYSSFMLVLTASLGAILDKKIPDGKIPHRTPLALPQMYQLCHLLPDISVPALLPIMSKIISQSGMIAKVMLPYWEAAIQYYKEDRYGLCVMLLLTQIEQSLRLVFATVNNCPDRVLTAESTVLFTTFDEMLCATLPDGSDNAIIQTVGVPIMDMLLDVLVHPEGPRLRDHISHGELNISDISQDVANYVLLLSTAICCFSQVKDGSISSEDQVTLNKSLYWSKHYTSVFHPISRLQSELTECITSLASWNNLSHPSHNELEYIPWCSFTEEAFATSNVYSTAKMMLEKSAEEHEIPELLRSLNAFGEIHALQTSCTKNRLKTLFRPRNELEVVALFRRVIRENQVAVCNVAKITEERYCQWQEKNLRSRQRNNYVRLLNSLPKFSSGLRLTLLIIVCEMQVVNTVSSHPSNKFKMLIKFLKAILQYSENLATLTAPDKNKWDECCHMTTALVDKVTAFYTKWHQI